MLDHIKIVLVNPTHPGNIGAAARAMKTMGLNKLHLVNPKLFPHVNATAMAAKADDILQTAYISNTLKTAIQESQLVFGTSARGRKLSPKILTPKQAALKMVNGNKNKIAILFGRENSGLTNQELALCHYHIFIPTEPDFSSLNLAAAVQLITYELKLASLNLPLYPQTNKALATAEEIDNFYQHLEKTLLALKFLNKQNSNSLIPKLKRLFNKSLLEKYEIDILRGILNAIDKRVENGQTDLS